MKIDPALLNQAVADAQSLPDLITKTQAIDPALAKSLEGKSLLASKSPWGTILLAIIGWLVSRYGLGWPPDVQALVSGACVLAGSYAMRYVTSARITGLFRHTPPSAARTGKPQL